MATIGGGATGSYAAIALTDLNRSVIVVKATGGQTNTYVDASYNVFIDYGVQRYGKDARTLVFLDRLGVTYSAHTSDDLTPPISLSISISQSESPCSNLFQVQISLVI